MGNRVSELDFGLQVCRNNFLMPGTSKGEIQGNIPEPGHKELTARKCLFLRRLSIQPPYVVLGVFVGKVVCVLGKNQCKVQTDGKYQV